MNYLYLGFAVVIVLVLIGFGISRWVQQSQYNRSVAFDTATPTPGAFPSAKPVQLQNGQTIGKPLIVPTPDPKHGKLADTPLGGHSQDVDGIPCQANEGVVLHTHSHLSLFYRGTQVQIPAFIGMAPTATGGCLYWLHTHDPSGVIHVEAGDVDAPNGGPFTLGMFFDIWGQPLTRSQVGPFKGDVTAFVNGAPYTGPLANIPLRSHELITLEVGQPVLPPKRYVLPPGD